MQIIADLQIHSRFARAVSSQMTIPVISEWAKKKGIDVVATGDWTHPIWFRELKASLVEASEGLYRHKSAEVESPLFLLSTEISSIYSKGGKTRRVHTLIFAPNFDVIGKINEKLVARGANLMSDGRPIVGLSARDVAEIALETDERCLIVPAHAWTPWFSLYGSQSGFDSIEECFEDLSDKIYAIETGLSSDPAMNWRIAELEKRQIVSFSDAHSPQKLGREATVFDLDKLNYESIRRAIVGGFEEKIAYTLEFYPEEGKYHYTGHRRCGVVHSPKETVKLGKVCPVCGRLLTVGVMSRVEDLASGDVELESSIDKFGVRWIKHRHGERPPYAMLVPLVEIASEVTGTGTGTKTTMALYDLLVDSLGSEFSILLKSHLDEIRKVAGEKMAKAIEKVRKGDISIKPGYDGVFGEVKIWRDEEGTKEEEPIDQEMLF
jgi:uncharacterized protein (TIGR00375 family)